MTTRLPWHQQVGYQRNWVWRGWQTRYTYTYPPLTAYPKPPLLLLHGFGASIGHWRYNVPVLSQATAVYALDLLGFGASEKALTSYPISLWAEQVHEFWCNFICTPIVLVGNSLGSLVCLAVAAHYPEMVAGIILLNLPDRSVLQEMIPEWLQLLSAPLELLTRPVRGLLTAILTSGPIFNPLFRLIRQPALIRFWAQQAYGSVQNVDNELVEILRQPAYARGAARALVAMTRSPRAFPTARSILPQLNVPIVLVWGKQDRFVPPFLGPLFQRHSSNLRLVELDQAGHCPHDECPEAVNQLILECLESWFDSKQGSQLS